MRLYHSFHLFLGGVGLPLFSLGELRIHTTRDALLMMKQASQALRCWKDVCHSAHIASEPVCDNDRRNLAKTVGFQQK